MYDFNCYREQLLENVGLLMLSTTHKNLDCQCYKK